MDGPLDFVSPSALAQLHRVSIQGPTGVADFLRLVQRRAGLLSNGINRRNSSRTARIEYVGASQFSLRFENLDEKHLPQLFLTCELDGRRYFFAVTPVGHEAKGLVRAPLPHAIYQSERRDLERGFDPAGPSEGARVEIRGSNGRLFSGVVADSSYHGLGVALPALSHEAPGGQVMVRFLSGAREGERAHGFVRHQSTIKERQGWVKIGLSVSDVPLGEPVEFEQREQILALDGVSRISHRATLIRSLVKAASARAVRKLGVKAPAASEPRVVTYSSAPGEVMRAIVDTWGDPRGATAVVIPPAWGRTKETLSPLAATIGETFRSVDKPVTVIRFDGTHRRGESYIPSGLRHPGAEYLQFTFSRAVRDIHATIDYLQNTPELRPSKIVLVTFSLAAVEGRRAVASDPSGLIAGWISVVGMVDLQSALKTISGGIDFAYGLSRGVRFGHHELVGVVSDMDHTGLDAMKHRLVFLEDARRDMAQISAPITWIHGRHDAWMDVGRVRHLMSCGDTTNRRVIEVPTGHQLRTSGEAFGVFGLVASEIGRMVSGVNLKPAIPDIAELDRRNQAERNRLPKTTVRLREFWSRYLLGRDARLGFQLLTATSAYRTFMHEQIDALDTFPRSRVLDLGCGTGDFGVQLATDYDLPEVTIDAVDFVREALHRAVSRITALHREHRVRLNAVLLDFDVDSGGGLPIKPESYDAALLSLVISYISNPQSLLTSIRSTLKPMGRLVISTLKRDADISRLHVEGLAELRAGRAEEEFGSETAQLIDEIARGFLNDASKILDLEEDGTFRFWDLDELSNLVRSAGFTIERSFHALGDPPQAAVIVAHRD